MKTATQNTLNSLTAEVTAFRTFAEFAEAMHNGYTPTLMTASGRSKKTKEHNAKVTELAYRIEELGFRVWRGSNG
jgi:hypothetical protein